MLQEQKLACLFMTLLALALCASAAYGGELSGRFFYTPEERAALDRLRVEGERSQRVRQAESTSPKEEAVREPSMRFQGIVLRSSGKKTVWLNDQSYNENELPSGIRSPSWSERGNRAVEIMGRSGSFTLKPGQTLDSHSGRKGEDKK